MTRRVTQSSFGQTCRFASVVASLLLLFASSTEEAAAQPRAKSGAPAGPQVAAKLYKRPLLRSGRIQFCLKQIGRYDGRINGRMTPATARALRRLRDDFDFKGDDVAQDWPLHALLWRQCRDEWSKSGGGLDRFGLAVAGVAAPKTPASSMPSDQVRGLMPASAAAPKQSLQPAVCLPADLRDILLRAQPPRPEIGLCEAPCLPLPANIDRDEAQGYERRLGFNWCKSCVPFAGELLFDDIARIEKAGNLTLCPDPRRLTRARIPAVMPGTSVVMDGLRGTRMLFRRDIHAAESHNGFAVVVGVSAYGKGLAPQPRAERDAVGMHALLVERLGFKTSRVVELKNPTLAELEDVFGRSGAAKGLLSDRLKDAGNAPVFVYFSGAGAVSGDNGEAYLLPVDAVANRERANGFALSTLYQNLTRLGAGAVTVLLEVNFASDQKLPLVSPNGPMTDADVLPRSPARGIVVISATDRDQRSLEDPETGLSLFTRFMLQGLSGHADVRPLGDGDGNVDSAEAFVYAASRTTTAAAKLFGILQRPTLSQARAVPVVRLGGPTR